MAESKSIGGNGLRPKADKTVTVDIVYRGGFSPIWKFWGFEGWRLRPKYGMVTEEVPVRSRESAPPPQ